MKVAALIPARKGSKGIPNKNFKYFCGKPLWQWSLDAALDSGIFSTIIVSSDNEDLKFCSITDEKLIIDYKRPAHLSTDEATLDLLLCHYMIQMPDVDVWCLLQPTSPLRTSEDIKKAYDVLNEPDEQMEYKYESIVSVYPHSVFAWIKNSVGIPGDDNNPQPLATYHYTKRPNRQNRKDWFLENGAIYFTRTYILKTFHSRLHGTIGLYEMPKERSVEIDDPFDWQLCEWLMKQMQRNTSFDEAAKGRRYDLHKLGGL